MTTNTLFHAWPGSWRIQRIIQQPDHTLKMIGTAQLTPQHTTQLLYQESGSLNGIETKAYDTFMHYLYQLNPMDQIEKYFNECTPRLFYTLHPLGEHTAQGVHHCGQDTYLATYDFSSLHLAQPHFRITTRVTGPHKDYTITTDYWRDCHQ